MSELKISKIIMATMIAFTMASVCTSWFYQWTLDGHINPLVLVEANNLEMTQEFIRILVWFGGLLVLPFFAEEVVNTFQLQKLKFGMVLLAIESVLLIYSFGLTEDLRAGLDLFACSQLLAVVNGIAISREITSHMRTGYTQHDHG